MDSRCSSAEFAKDWSGRSDSSVQLRSPVQLCCSSHPMAINFDKRSPIVRVSKCAFKYGRDEEANLRLPALHFV